MREENRVLEFLAVRTISLLAVSALVCAFTLAVASTAEAQKARSVQTEAVWIKFDPEAKTVTAKVKKPGRGKDAKLLKRNKEAVFLVKPEGSVLTRTTVAINGVKGELSDIPEGKTVNIYWRPDEKDKTKPRARKIDVIFSDEELLERYKAD
ncbi:MAG: hypothetical protein ACE5FL_12490 [Myxococcota bacterium]